MALTAVKLREGRPRFRAVFPFQAIARRARADILREHAAEEIGVEITKFGGGTPVPVQSGRFMFLSGLSDGTVQSRTSRAILEDLADRNRDRRCRVRSSRLFNRLRDTADARHDADVDEL